MLDSGIVETHSIVYPCVGGVSQADALVTALYCRVANANAESIAIQEAVLRRYAEEHGYGVFKVYHDSGMGGIALDRPGLQLMLRDIESGIVKRIIISDFVRLARDYITAYKLKKIFDMYGVELVSVRDIGAMDNAYINPFIGEIRGCV
jgi:DNA invertase Pin-like site-specific DNA recombinase